MAITEIRGGPRDGDNITCACLDECACESFGHAIGNNIMDGYVEFLMYRKEGGCWVPDHIKRKVMVGGLNLCPRCDRPMPKGTVNCLNCDAEMDVSEEWE